MSKYTDPLAHVRVAAPCTASWEGMSGNESVRFCAQCSLNVYNLSGMTRKEAETLVTNSEGRLCVRFYRRADGTILTGNCPVGLRALKRRFSRVTNALLSSVLGFFAGLGINLALYPLKESILPFQERTMGAVAVQELPIPVTVADMGQMPVQGQMVGDAVMGKMPVTQTNGRWGNKRAARGR